MAPSEERKPREKKKYMYTNIIERSGTHATIESTTTSTQISDIPNDCIHCVIRAKLKISTLYPKRLSDAIETNLFSKFLKIFHWSISCRLLNIPPNFEGSKSNYLNVFIFFFDFMFGAAYHLAQMDSVKRAHISRWIEKLFSVSICLNFKSIYMLFGMKNESKKS